MNTASQHAPNPPVELLGIKEDEFSSDAFGRIGSQYHRVSRSETYHSALISFNYLKRRSLPFSRMKGRDCDEFETYRKGPPCPPRTTVSYEQDPTLRSDCTIQSVKFAIEAKNYVRLRWTPSLKSSSPNGKNKKVNDSRRYHRKVITCFPFLSILRHKKVPAQNGDQPQSEIVLQELIGESSIMRLEDIQRIGEELPPSAVGFPWRLRFCSSRDGYSLHNLYRKLSKSDSPVLLVIEDLHGRVFGGLSSSTIKISENFFGTSECFLFTCYPEFKVFKWNGDNFYFVKADEGSLAFGSGFGYAGLWFDSDLNKGRTDCCLTYGNPPLIPESDFIIKNLECWTFG